MQKVIDVISKGAAGSWQMENRHKTMIAASTITASPSTGCARISPSSCPRPTTTAPRVPVTALIDQFYKDVQTMGGKRWDTSSLLARLQKIDGIG
jgi:3-hydroxyisobutyrate dehydrogenase